MGMNIDSYRELYRKVLEGIDGGASFYLVHRYNPILLYYDEDGIRSTSHSKFLAYIECNCRDCSAHLSMLQIGDLVNEEDLWE